MTRTLPRCIGALVPAAAVLLSSTTPAAAQDAAEIVDRMLAEYESRAEGVDNYTLVQSVMGFETVSYFVKDVEDGRPVFRLEISSAQGVDETGPGGVDEIYAIGDDFAEHATYAGRENIDDYDVHVLDLEDLESSEIAQDVSPDGDFVPTRGRLYLDVDTYVPRRMIFEGELTNDEGVHSVTMTMDLGDYREIEGMLVAHRTVMSIEGLGAAMDQEARAQFDELERELESMPPEQRRMVEGMMADQLEQFRAMMAGDNEPMVIEVMVREVRVNSGPPGAP